MRASQDRLGVRPANDAEGCLQDVHWAVGSFGYFPSYAMGAVIAGQLYESLRADRPELDEEIAAGHFAGLFDWLRQNVHGVAATVSMPELIRNATGKPLSAAAVVALHRRQVPAKSETAYASAAVPDPRTTSSACRRGCAASSARRSKTSA